MAEPEVKPKREREEGGDPAAEVGQETEEEGAAAKKPKLEEAKEAEKGKTEETAEEKTLEANEEKAVEAEGKPVTEEANEEKAVEAEGKPVTEEANEEKAAEAEGKPVKLGPKEFASAIEMFNYFYALLHSWTPQLEFNKYEQMVLEDLLKKGHAEPAKKIGAGVEAFEIRNHPVWKSHCFFVRRIDGSVDDFSFRKCVDNILPLPEDFKIGNGKKSGGHQKGGGGGRGGGRQGGGRGGWRGGRGRGRRGG